MEVQLKFLFFIFTFGILENKYVKIIILKKISESVLL